MTGQAATDDAAQPRIASIDQLRGYAILTMVFVNFVGRFDVTPWMLQHHKTGMSFNDTIAPIFIFVVGMGFRLSSARRTEAATMRQARLHAARRYVLLTLLGCLVYFGYFWDALTDIGIAGLLTLFLMDKPGGIRLAAAALFLGAYQALFSLTGYGQWVMAHSLNGGPLGPLSWGFILLMGTLAYDLIATRDRRRILIGCLAWGGGLSAVGWLLKIPWGPLKPEWPFSQYGMSAPYPLFATGLCFLTLLAFHRLCDVARWRVPHLTTLGKNPLALYLAHGVLLAMGLLILPDTASWPAIAGGFLAVYALLYGLARWLSLRGIVLKL